MAPAFTTLLGDPCQPIVAVSFTPTGLDGDPRVQYSFWTEMPPATPASCPEWSMDTPLPRMSFSNVARAPVWDDCNLRWSVPNGGPETAELFSLLSLTTCRVFYIHGIATNTIFWEGDTLINGATKVDTIEAWGDSMAARALIHLLSPPSEGTMTARLPSLRIICFVDISMDFQVQELADMLDRMSVRRAAHTFPVLDVQFRNPAA